MKILINASLDYQGGGLQVTLSFLCECMLISENVYHVLVNKNMMQCIDENKYSSNFVFYETPLLKFYQYNAYLAKIEKVIQPDIVFTPFGPTYWRPKAPHLVGFALGHYVYMESPYFNIISLKSKLILKLKKRIHLYYLKRDSDALVSETIDVTHRIETIFGKDKKYFTVSNTCGKQYFDKIQDTKIKRLQPKKEKEMRLLTVCKYYPHKNIEIIKNIVDKLSIDDNLLFVLTISKEDYYRIFEDKYKNNVITVGVVSPEDCPSLYRECDCMFLPTLVECFSASYVEAMVMGKPILTSDLGFAHSICEDAALYFDPLDADSIISQIRKIESSESIKKQLIMKGMERSRCFPTAKQRAEAYLEICKSLFSNV